MPFPGSREETAGPANPVKSATINAIQDAIVDIYNVGGIARPLRQRKIAADSGSYTGGTWIDGGAGEPIIAWRSNAASQKFGMSLVLDAGEVLTKVLVDYTGDAGGGQTASVWVSERSNSGGSYRLTETGNIPAANADGTITLDNYDAGYPFLGGAPLAKLIADDTFYYRLVVACDATVPVGTGIKIYGIRYYTYVPAP